MALGLNDFDGGQILYSGHMKGWALKISTFFGFFSFSQIAGIENK
jgi:hypothetical protein